MGMKVNMIRKWKKDLLIEWCDTLNNHRYMNSSSSGRDYQKMRLAKSSSNTCGNLRSKYKRLRTRRQRGRCRFRWGRMSQTALKYSRMPWISLDFSRVCFKGFHPIPHMCRILDICIERSGCTILAVGSNRSPPLIEEVNVYIYPQGELICTWNISSVMQSILPNSLSLSELCWACMCLLSFSSLS